MYNTCVSNPIGPNLMVPIPSTGNKVPSAVLTCLPLSKGVKILKFSIIGVILSVAPESRIQASLIDLFETQKTSKSDKILVLPNPANEVDPIIDLEEVTRFFNCYISSWASL